MAQDLANRAQEWWSSNNKSDLEVKENIDPFTYTRRTCQEIKLGQPHISLGDKKPPTVFVSTHFPTFDTAAIIKEIAQVQTQSKDVPVEGLIVRIRTSSEFSSLNLAQSLVGAIPLIIVEDERENDDELPPAKPGCVPLAWHPSAGFTEEAPLARFLAFCDQAGHYPIISLPARELSDGTVALLACSPKSPLLLLHLPTNPHRSRVWSLSHMPSPNQLSCLYGFVPVKRSSLSGC